MKKSYIDRHWKWIVNKSFDYSLMSRKTKKAAKQYFDSFEDDCLTEDEIRFLQLPDCKWCYGSGTYRDHPNDSGYGCPDCYGSGKTGWEFSAFGEKVIIK